MSSKLDPLKTMFAYALLAALAGAMVFFYVQGLPAAVERDRMGACLALDPEIVDVDASFELPDAQGKIHRLKDYRGKMLLINFWATWCPPCVEELPSMEKLARLLRGKPFEFLAVSVDESWNKVHEFFRQFDDPTALTVLLDPSREFAHRLGTEKFPETYLVDPTGHVLYRFVNKRDWTKAAECIWGQAPP